MVVQILKRQKPANMPVRYLKHGTPVLNLKAAKKLGLRCQGLLPEAKQKGTIYK